MTTVTYVQGAERMVTAARLEADGLYVRFADDRAGIIPFGRLGLRSGPKGVHLPTPHAIEVHLEGGDVEEIPWDFARHFADEGHRGRAEQSAVRSRRVFGERLRALRSERRMTQDEVAKRARVNRVTVARIETGEQLPRYGTVIALAEALEVPVERLLVG